MSRVDPPAPDEERASPPGKAPLAERVRGVLANLGRETRWWLLTRTLPVLYYRYLYGREGFLAGAGARLARWWEDRWSLYDAPMPRTVWERDYEAGQWDYMAEAREAPRYAVIAGYLRAFARDGTVLDVGCGTGLLQDHLATSDRGLYVGIDVSLGALRRARRRGDESAALVVADAASFTPGSRVDAVVFNEVLYYLEEPLRHVARYGERLRPGGVLIVSAYHGSPRALGILRRLEEMTCPIARSTTRSHGNTWTCSVFRPDR